MRRLLVPCLVLMVLVTAPIFSTTVTDKTREKPRESFAVQRTSTILATIPTALATTTLAPAPPTFTVTGTVNVGNLPLDSEGNVRVSARSECGAPRPLHFIGVSQETVPRSGDFDADAYPIFAANRACHAEFPGTRICVWGEMTRSVPPPPAWPGFILIATTLDSPSSNAAPYDAAGQIAFLQDPLPAACCGL